MAEMRKKPSYAKMSVAKLRKTVGWNMWSVLDKKSKEYYIEQAKKSVGSVRFSTKGQYVLADQVQDDVMFQALIPQAPPAPQLSCPFRGRSSKTKTQVFGNSIVKPIGDKVKAEIPYNEKRALKRPSIQACQDAGLFGRDARKRCAFGFMPRADPSKNGAPGRPKKAYIVSDAELKASLADCVQVSPMYSVHHSDFMKAFKASRFKTWSGAKHLHKRLKYRQFCRRAHPRKVPIKKATRFLYKCEMCHIWDVCFRRRRKH